MFQAAVPGLCTCTNMEMMLHGRHRDSFPPKKQSTRLSIILFVFLATPGQSGPKVSQSQGQTGTQVSCLRAESGKEGTGRIGRGLPRGPVPCFQDSQEWKQKLISST